MEIHARYDSVEEVVASADSRPRLFRRQRLVWLSLPRREQSEVMLEMPQLLVLPLFAGEFAERQVRLVLSLMIAGMSFGQQEKLTVSTKASTIN